MGNSNNSSPSRSPNSIARPPARPPTQNAPQQTSRDSNGEEMPLDLLLFILRQLAEHAAAQAGPEPASDEAINALPTETITTDETTICTVCQEQFVVNDEVKRLPCQHRFHTDCISPWLKIHGTCPICRADLQGKETDALVEIAEEDEVNVDDEQAVNSSASSLPWNAVSDDSDEPLVWCYKCEAERVPILPDYLCSECHEGFLEDAAEHRARACNNNANQSPQANNIRLINRAAAVATPDRPVWCHQCNAETVARMPSFVCRRCGNGCVEDIADYRQGVEAERNRIINGLVSEFRQREAARTGSNSIPTTPTSPSGPAMVWCHQCSSEVAAVMPANVCSRCNGGFVEASTSSGRREAAVRSFLVNRMAELQAESMRRERQTATSNPQTSNR